MSYPMKKNGVFESTTPVVLTSAAVIKKFAVARPMVVLQVQAHVAVAVVADTSPVVITIKKYITTGSSSGEVTLGTIKIPTAAAAGKVYYKDLAAPCTIAPGDELVFEVTSAADGASKAGSVICSFDAYDAPEMAANISDMVASA